MYNFTEVEIIFFIGLATFFGFLIILAMLVAKITSNNRYLKFIDGSPVVGLMTCSVLAMTITIIVTFLFWYTKVLHLIEII